MKPAKNQNHLIFICTGKDCQKNGCEELKSELKQSFKANKIKNVKLIKTKCMDYCKLGPNLVVNGKLLHECKNEDISTIIEILKNSTS
ncbi:(2Fe-2S) ferredoxin domain-containing protein [Marivirga salinae]|uniref:(2Fe-2S) ferredoxin domain-containing protein n=1 Tax=Marivirga salinarum TaxID=3059078 RepID=A0AA49GCW1_9BACT|nr:(2Fe-2S) ferredoxin domain-containing protein [Marivirga sp. BDSF4-3]WKK78133.1 (2Fe-2S) ferredoxin domain-containing protein [Marivirga sp. BDSF4-3]